MPSVVALVIAVFAGLVAPLPAAAEPAGSTLAVLAVAPPQQHVPYVLRASVVAEGGVSPAGVVVFSEDGAEIARSPVIFGSATLTLASPTPVTRTMTATYLGSADVAGSTGQTTFTVAPYEPPNPMTGTLDAGSVSFALGAGNSFSINEGPDLYEPVSGHIEDLRTRATTTTVDTVVGGWGPVSITVIPTWQRQPRVRSDGTVDGTGVLGIAVVTSTVNGITRVGGCGYTAGSTAITGTRHDGGLSLATSGTFAPLAATDCFGRAGLLNQILAGPVSFAVEVPGDFPLPAPIGTPTTTELVVAAPNPSVQELAYATATVSASGYPPLGYVNFFVNGEQRAYRFVVDGSATVPLNLEDTGLLEITAVYSGHREVLQTSSDSVVIDVAAAPDGRPATGQAALGSLPTTTLPEGSRLVGGAVDHATGEIGPGTFWFPQGDAETGTFIATTRYRLVQTAPATGQIAPDGTATFGPATFVVEARSYNSITQPTLLDDCTIGPFTGALTGTADGAGLHVSAADMAIPPLADSACRGLAPYLNEMLSTGADLTLDVDGDFRRDGAPTPVTLSSWFPAVAQHDQTFLVAHVAGTPSPRPSGTVTFRDGPTVLGQSPVGPGGYATLAVAMHDSGARTITADYSGDPSYGDGSGTTEVVVAPAPTGRPTTGTIGIAGGALAVGSGSAMVPGGSPGNEALRFTPFTFDLDVPGLGVVEVEAGLTPAGDLTPHGGEGGGPTGLGGLFGLHIRQVSTPSATTTPLGCAAIVGLVLDPAVGPTTTTYTATTGAIARWDTTTCSGAGRAVVDALVEGPVSATLVVDG